MNMEYPPQLKFHNFMMKLVWNQSQNTLQEETSKFLFEYMKMPLMAYFLSVISGCVTSVIQKVHINSKTVVWSYKWMFY